jgi:hypothetical protein
MLYTSGGRVGGDVFRRCIETTILEKIFLELVVLICSQSALATRPPGIYKIIK